MTQLPRSLGLTLVLRLNQETVHDFVPLFLPPCGPHLTPLATGSLKPSLLVFSTPGGLTGDDLSRLFFTCTNNSQVATRTCNTLPRVSPHNVVNHSSHQETTIHRSSNHTWSTPSTNKFNPLLERGIITFINMYLLLSSPLSLVHVLDPKEIPTSRNFGFLVIFS
jgi:hypothetical protein